MSAPQQQPPSSQYVQVETLQVDDKRTEAQKRAEHILRTGLFECCEDPWACVCATFCSACVTGNLAERVGLGECCCWTSCLICFPESMVCLQAHVRSELHHLAGIHTPRFFDYACVHCWCHPCAVAQEYRASKALMKPAIAAVRDGL
jgi:Cys-rich protein (TIGR01571 family)